MRRAGVLALALALGAAIVSSGCASSLRVVKTIEREIPAPAGAAASLSIDSDRGDLALLCPPPVLTRERLVSVRVTLVTMAEPPARDAEAVRNLVFELRTVDAERARLVVGIRPEVPGYFADVRVAVSPSLHEASIRQGAGDVGIVGTGLGKLTLRDGAGDVFIGGTNGQPGLGGDLDLEDTAGDITILGVGGSARIEDASGDLHVESVQRDLTIDDDSGDIRVIRVRGTLTVRDGSGDIHLTATPVIELERDTSGDLDID